MCSDQLSTCVGKSHLPTCSFTLRLTGSFSTSLSYLPLSTDQLSTCVAQKKEPYKALGIKNSWKYEKDLIIILNQVVYKKTISKVGNIF